MYSHMKYITFTITFLFHQPIIDNTIQYLSIQYLYLFCEWKYYGGLRKLIIKQLFSPTIDILLKSVMSVKLINNWK